MNQISTSIKEILNIWWSLLSRHIFAFIFCSPETNGSHSDRIVIVVSPNLNTYQTYPQVHISQMHCSFSAAVGFGFGFFSSTGCLRGPSFFDVMMSSRVVNVFTDRSTTSIDSFYIITFKKKHIKNNTNQRQAYTNCQKPISIHIEQPIKSY